MATLQEIFALRHSGDTFRGRVIAAVAKAATEVLSESPATANHLARRRWARAALADAPAMSERMLWGVVQNSAIQAHGTSSSDGDLLAAVRGLIDAFAPALPTAI